MDQENNPNRDLIPLRKLSRDGLSAGIIHRGLELLETLVIPENIKGLEKSSLIGSHNDGVSCISLSPDGSLLASSSWDNKIHVWDLDQRNIIKTLTGHRGKVKKVGFTENKSGLISIGEDKKLIIWNIENCTPTRVIDGMNAIAISSSGEYVAITSDWGTGVRWFDVKKLKVIRSLSSFGSQVLSGAISHNGQLVVTGGRDGNIIIWDKKEEAVIKLENHKDWVWSVDLNSTSELILSASADGIVQEQRIDPTTPPKLYLGHFNSVYCSKYVLSDNYIVSGGADKTLRLWDRSSFRVLQVNKLSSEVISIAVQDAHKILITGTRAGDIQLWGY